MNETNTQACHGCGFPISKTCSIDCYKKSAPAVSAPARLDPAMAALAARTAAAWRAEQDQRADALPIVTAQCAGRGYGPHVRAPLDAQCIDCQATLVAHDGQWHAVVTASTAHILIPALQALRPELVHFAGAAHRDPAALAVVQEWQIDREASDDVLRERGLARRGGAW